MLTLSYLSLDMWTGSISQESASFNTLTDDTSYEGAGYATYSGSRPTSRLAWVSRSC